MDITITFLGTGTSQGVPMIACPCEVCASKDERDHRLRTSALVQIGDRNILLDAGPDFRTQILSVGIKTLDAILLTHEHRDHVAGLDDVRAFNYFQYKPADIYAEQRVLDSIKQMFAYAFVDHNKYPGAPDINLHKVDEQLPFSIVDGIEITPIRVFHYKLPIYGYRIGRFAYITDANRIDDNEISKLEGVDTLVLNALRHSSHLSHFSLPQAIEIANRIKPRQTFFTHMSHQIGFYAQTQTILPKGMFLAYDGLKVSCPFL